MVIRKKPEAFGPLEIDLTGPEGNAWVLMAYAKRFAKELDLDEKAILEDMISGDYEHLIEVFDSHFGSFVILYR